MGWIGRCIGKHIHHPSKAPEQYAADRQNQINTNLNISLCLVHCFVHVTWPSRWCIWAAKLEADHWCIARRRFCDWCLLKLVSLQFQKPIWDAMDQHFNISLCCMQISISKIWSSRWCIWAANLEPIIGVSHVVVSVFGHCWN